MTKLTNADFAGQAACLAKNAAAWAGDTCLLPNSLHETMRDETLARFIHAMQAHLDRLWLWDLQWEPAFPKEGEAGSSFQSARHSTRWPGLYVGRCHACEAFMLAEKRAPRCDECEDRREAAIAERRSALARSHGGGDV